MGRRLEGGGSSSVSDPRCFPQHHRHHHLITTATTPPPPPPPTPPHPTSPPPPPPPHHHPTPMSTCRRLICGDGSGFTSHVTVSLSSLRSLPGSNNFLRATSTVARLAVNDAICIPGIGTTPHQTRIT
ncbi:hypothetical protein C0Q70_20708 [Pomacea canaliculata]|uniref:Uncharacterized protein n=1 Tax=Pomacea canaliculata TaxID=400727 RepID=A0A2T7NGE7_POMCA|nr:hypothetical protein C0Q70_20708 [Pomacea canaliculata]